jgi:hypothetical protein
MMTHSYSPSTWEVEAGRQGVQCQLVPHSKTLSLKREGGRKEEGREGEREKGREGGRKEGKEGGREERKGGRERGRERGREKEGLTFGSLSTTRWL